MDGAALAVLRRRLESGALTMRGAERVRALALTLADLKGDAPPLSLELIEQAALLRGGDRAAGAVA
jgi:predicted ATPase with chaperone activity